MITLGDTLSTRDAIDARVAAGTIVPQLRADDAAGQAAMRACLTSGASPAECASSVGSSIDSRGFFCPTTLRIDANGRTCIANSAPSPAKAAILEREAEARASANLPLITPARVLVVGGAAAFVLYMLVKR